MTSDKGSGDQVFAGKKTSAGTKSPAADKNPVGVKAPTMIKKYANRRLYDTGTSAYVTLEDLAVMVKRGEDFVVSDARTGEDITRSVLTQIIFEQEGKGGQSLLPIAFLRQLIRFYGTGMQMLVPSYLEFSLDKLTADRSGFREQWAAAFGNTPFAAPPMVEAARPILGQIEEQTRQNMAMFRQALAVFTPFVPGAPAGGGSDTAPPPDEGPNGNATIEDTEALDSAPPSASPLEASPARDEFDEMKRQLDDMRRRVEELAAKR